MRNWHYLSITRRQINKQIDTRSPFLWDIAPRHLVIGAWNIVTAWWSHFHWSKTFYGILDPCAQLTNAVYLFLTSPPIWLWGLLLDKNMTLPLRYRWQCARGQDGRSSNAAAGPHLQVARYNERKGHASLDTECPGDRVVRPSSDVMQIKGVIRSIIQSGNEFYFSVMFMRNINCYWNVILGVNYTLITNLMHWLLFIHKLLFSSTCFEHQVLIFRRT